MKILTLLALLLFVNFSYSQVIRCYTDENELELRAQFPQLESKEDFENWLQEEMNSNAEARIIGGVYQIPMVFHIIHNGENIGTGSNISYAAVQSQVDVLNEDFRRILNTNGFNTNPVGADTEIEFCLARRRPDGSAFPNEEYGVNRINRNTAGFTAPPYSTNYINGTIKPYTYNNGNPTATRGWLPSFYMNIWIANLANGVLGYAQFPQSPIGGMNCGNQTTATDGVVFTYTSVGKSSVTGFSPPYNEGRTATHEIGHWLGLRHIWGDGGCTVDDFCNDTPVAGSANYGCPNNRNTCTDSPGNDMVENYMDYTDDMCMNIFTNDQKMRMRTVLESTPLRRSLINSDACIPPSENDLSVIDILNPIGDNCPGSISPSVVIKNRGTNPLESAQISYRLNAGAITTFTYSGNLASGQTETIILPEFTSYLGNHSLTVYSTLPNGVEDPNPEFDTMQINFTVSNGITAPFLENFEANVFPPNIKWVVENENSDCYKWLGAAASSISGVTDNNAAQLPGFGNTSGGRESLITPIFILPCNASAANIQFDVAYRRRNNTTSNYERLFIEISENCGLTWNSTPIYDKTGTNLQVITQTTTSYYTPIGTNDWRTETVDLSSFVDTESKNIKFRIRAVAANGNNIYIDNFRFNAVTSSEIVVSENSMEVFDEGGVEFGFAEVGSSLTKTFTVENLGTGDLIINLPISITGSVFTIENSNLTTTIPSGDSQTFDIVFSPNQGGNYSETLSFETNDCDEGIYNFILNGNTGNEILQADFTTPNPENCLNSVVNFTSTSSFATSYFWDFGPNAIPQTSTEENPSVIYTESGIYDVTLIVTNEFGSNTMNKIEFITINDVLNPSISITTDNQELSICQGNEITFEASFLNGGENPILDWKINGNSTGNSESIFSTNALNNGDIISCELISNSECASTNLVESNSISVQVNELLTPTILISSNDSDNSICSGTLVNFTATIENGGSTPNFQWKLNGNNVGTSSSTYSSSSISNNAIITCILSSNEQCLSENQVSSNEIQFQVTPSISAYVTISSNDIDNIIDEGTNVTFTANSNNGSNTATYQWFINGVEVGTNSNSFSSNSIENGDVISCELTLLGECVINSSSTSNSITITVLGTSSILDFDKEVLFVSLSPNPFQTNFSLKINGNNDENTSIKITDMSGKIVQEIIVPYKNQEIVLGAEFQNGVYNLEVKQGENLRFLRVVKL
jgi:PKD repeat protein